MEIVSVEVFITKQYVFRKDNQDYSCLVQIKNNQIADILITTNSGFQPDSTIIEEIKSLITI